MERLFLKGAEHNFSSLLLDKHRIAKTEKTVLFLNRQPIDLERLFFSHKRGNEHEQCAFREMKIGNQRIDTSKAVAGIDENIRIPTLLLHSALLIRCAFQRAHRLSLIHISRNHAPHCYYLNLSAVSYFICTLGSQ